MKSLGGQWWLCRNGGHNPFKGATHVLDFDLTEGHDRGGRRLTVPDSARLILGQAMALPFETASFDYVYASHVLEHVDVPEAACREIMRVGAAGYIETPSPFLEQGLAVAAKQPPEYWAHKWFVWSGVPNQLVFEPRTGGGTHRFCSCADGRFMQEFYASVDFAEAQHCFRRSAKTTMFYWESGFHVQVREQTIDCTTDDRACRFTGTRKALVGPKKKPKKKGSGVFSRPSVLNKRVMRNESTPDRGRLMARARVRFSWSGDRCGVW